jgi:photosystem II protein PsbQ
MARFRPVLTLVLVLFAVVLVSCGGPTETKTPTYTTAQIEKIQQYASSILKDRDRLQQELTAEVQSQDWSDVRSLIHGPLGEIRQDMNNLARNLVPQKAQADARQVTKDFFKNLVDIDEAAQKQDSATTLSAYKAALENLDKFLDLTASALEGAKVS